MSISFFVLVLGSCDKSTDNKLQKTPQFIPECVDTAGNFVDTSYVRTYCDEEFQFRVACGTRPGQVDPEVYCIDSYDIVAFGKEASCYNSKYKVQCRLRK